MLHDCYSVFMLITGFSLAARQFWKVTVTIVTADTSRKASMNTHQ